MHFGENLLSAGGQGCYDRFSQVWEEVNDAFITGNTTELEEEFMLCLPPDITNKYDLAIFGGIFTESMDKAVRRSTYPRIANFCEILSDPVHTSAIAAMGFYFRLLFTGDDCIPASYDLFFPSIASEKWEAEAVRQGIRQWFYQTCSEYGTFISTDSPFQPFSNLLPGELWHEACHVLYGITPEMIQRGAEYKNARYGGLNPNVTNVYFTNSGMNSYRFLTLLSDLNPLAPSDLYPREGQLSDLRSINEDVDSAELLFIKRRLRTLVHQWLAIE